MYARVKMGLLNSIIVKGAETAFKKSLIDAAGNAASKVILATSKSLESKEDSTVKNGLLYVRPSRSAEEYINKDAVSIANELIGCGFERVELKPCKTLTSFGVKRYGLIKKVTINGKSDFGTLKKIPSTAYIIVEYLDFKESVNPSVYDKIDGEIIPGMVGDFIDKHEFDSLDYDNVSYEDQYEYGEVPFQQTATNNNTSVLRNNEMDNKFPSEMPELPKDMPPIPTSININFCPFCGMKITSDNARFCSGCGKSLLD